MPLTEAELTTLTENEAAIDAAVVAQDAFVKTLVADPPVVVTPPPLTITAVPAQVWTIGTPLSAIQLNATGGAGSGYEYSGTLVAGTSVTQAGEIAGTPSGPAAEAAQYTVTVHDPDGNSASTTITITVVAAVVVTPPPVVVTPPATTWPTPSLPAGYVAPDGLTFPSQAQWYTTFAASEAPSRYLPYWYKEGDTQNGTVMDQENVSYGPNGLGLTLTAAKSGGLISTAPWAGAVPGVLLAPAAGRPVYLEFSATLPALADGKTPANWIELWLVGQNWPVDKEFDLYESLSGAGYGHFHWGSNNQSIGWSDGINAGLHTFGMFWSVEDSAQFFVDSKLVESIPAADIQNLSPQAIVLGNSLPIQAGVDLLLPTTVQVHHLTLLQNAAA